MSMGELRPSEVERGPKTLVGSVWRRSQVSHEALLCAGLAATVGGLLVWLGPPGTDFAAHAYQRALFLEHGFTLWDNFWYAGRYSFIDYSVLYYPLAAALGIKLLAVATVALAALAFASCRGASGDRRPLVESRLRGRVGWILALGRVSVCARSRARPTGDLGTSGRTLVGASPFNAADPGREPGRAPFLESCSPAWSWPAAGLAEKRWVPPRPPCLAVTLSSSCCGCSRAEGAIPSNCDGAAIGSRSASSGSACTWRVDGRKRPRVRLRCRMLVAMIAVLSRPVGLGENIARLRYMAMPLAVLIVGLRRWRPLPADARPRRARALVERDATRGGIDARTSRISQPEPPTGGRRSPILHAHLRTQLPRRGGRHHRALARLSTSPTPTSPSSADGSGKTTFRRTKCCTASSDRARTRAGCKGSASPTSCSPARRRTTARARGRARTQRTRRPPPRLGIVGNRHLQGVKTETDRDRAGRPTLLALRESRLLIRVTRGGTYRVAVHWSPYWHTSNGCLDPRTAECSACARAPRQRSESTSTSMRADCSTRSRAPSLPAQTDDPRGSGTIGRQRG